MFRPLMDKPTSSTFTVCRFQTIKSRRENPMDRFDAMQAFACVVEAGKALTGTGS